MILNTQQIILLCLLMSFITSIATGITVVSLLQQTPEPVTQTINRVIERTVETVTQQPIEDIKNIITQQPPKPQKEVVTVVVNQEDQSINAVQKNEASIVRIKDDTHDQNIVTLAILMNTQGDVVADKRLINKNTTYNADYSGRTFKVKYISGSETENFVTLKIIKDSPNDFVPADFGDSDSLKLAQSVISLSGLTDTRVSTGEIQALGKNSENVLTSITTSVNSTNVLTGSVLLNLTGSIIGIKIASIENKTIFLPINVFKAEIKSVNQP